MLSALFDPFLTLLYPPRCLVCKTLGESGLCADCAAQITPMAAPLCPVCGQTMLADADGCLHCRRRLPAFARARALGAYDGVLRHAIHHFKYRDKPQMAVPLGRLLVAYARDHAAELNGLRFDALLPVPMHSIRQRQRGYNQSERLARVLGGEIGLPLLTNVLIRARPTRPQVGLTGDDRRTNLRDAFEVKQPLLVAGKTLLLIDDVVTSGSSLHECALVLRAAGANAVYALALAAG
ncbi:MAG: double zinc ribbon domain-containing protein [Janthinobacterium lividum]